ncbi:uncharacterized protein LOC127716365 [Mytilus californianus]|uniref:uncharacterized protein LOC127716365 n=1 Tax=Mytilus californianus TaxID=6549 RepID=UPI0022476FC3|nr:uncharacterized protein LOC127716365 [Mytilus californianus]
MDFQLYKLVQTELSLIHAILLTFMQLLNMLNAQNETLTATITAKYLYSHGYPTEYPNNLLYDWLITSDSPTEFVNIIVEDCEIEILEGKVTSACQVDKLSIYDGEFDNSTALYKSCCITDVPALNSTGPYILIRFVTDNSIVARGFRIKYYNSANKSTDEAAAAFGLYIAIAVVIVAVCVILVVIAFYIYKRKKTKTHSQRVNPLGREEANTSTKTDKYQETEPVDEYNKPPLPSDSSVPLPNGWSELEGMVAPQNIGHKLDIINYKNLPDGNTRGNKLPPNQQGN